MNHAFTYRNVLCGGLIYAALGFVQIAQAGFAQLRPPDGYQSTPTGSTFRAPANQPFIMGSAEARATLNVGGRTIEVPAKFRVSANAPQIAARHLFRHPLVAAAGVAALLVPLGIEFANGQWNRSTEPLHNHPISDGFRWRPSYRGNPLPRGITPLMHCQRNPGVTCTITYQSENRISFHSVGPGFAGFGGTFYRYTDTTCPVGWIITPAGCVQTLQPVTRPLTEEEFVPLVAPQIQPAQVPNIIPNTVPIPVEVPTINPAPRTVPVPYTPPVPRPLIVPLSDPVPIPNTEPQQWRQPLVQINPSPTPGNAWRVSLNPKERITTSPHGITDPVSNLDPATPAQPYPGSDFCIRNPGVLACAPLPELDIPIYEIQRLTEVVTYQPEQFLGGGSCPRPVTVNLGGQTIVAFDTPVYCQLISSYFRPVLLAIAAFTSMMIVAGGFRSV